MVATTGVIGGKRWALAKSLVALFVEADRLYPDRSRASDGSIGDPAHAARDSDHNPDASGDVLAADLTDDKAHGCDADALADHLVAIHDQRVEYVIRNGQRAKSYGSNAWTWRTYTGVNAHASHTHISIHDTDAAKNDTSPWFPTQGVDMTPDEVKAAVRAVLNEGTATGQTSWAGTSKATLAAIQANANRLAALPSATKIADAVVAKLPPSASGGITKADVVAAVKQALSEGAG